MSLTYRQLATLLVAVVSALASEPGGVAGQISRAAVLRNPAGAHPSAGVIRDSAGNLYGTAYNYGPQGAGTVFRLSASGEVIVLHSFTGGADGGHPTAGVIADADSLYGTASAGGMTTGQCKHFMFHGCGVVYKLDKARHETVLHTFTGNPDGAVPCAGLIRDTAGNLYGTTFYGGSANGGAIFKIDSAGNETVLHSFSGPDGALPYAGVIRDAAGNLYGTTFGGGPTGDGVVYKLDPAGRLKVLYRFVQAAHGYGTYAGVIRDAEGNLYGTTGFGGAGSCNPEGCGVVFKLDPSGQQTVLYSFTGTPDGEGPYALTRDAAGNLYGVASYSGATGNGMVFKVSASGQETALYNFMGGSDGSFPDSVLLDSNGHLYGTTFNGGAAGMGTVYEIDEAGKETVLYSFPAGTSLGIH